MAQSAAALGRGEPVRSTATGLQATDAVIAAMAAASEALRGREKALRESEERYRRQYKGIPIPTYSWRRVGDDFVMEECNDAAVVAAREALQWIGSHASDGLAGELEGLDARGECSASFIVQAAVGTAPG